MLVSGFGTGVLRGKIFLDAAFLFHRGSHGKRKEMHLFFCELWTLNSFSRSCCLKCAQAGDTCGTWHRYLRTDLCQGKAQPCSAQNSGEAEASWEPPSVLILCKSRERQIPQSSLGWQHCPHSVPALQTGTCTTAAKSITNQPKPKLFLLMTPQILL